MKLIHCAKVAQRMVNITGEKLDHGRGTWNFEKMDVQKEASAETVTQVWDKRQRLQSKREFTKIYRKTTGPEIVK
jgi:hypothetical protein